MTSRTQAPPAGRYRIDPDTSEIAFTAKHLFGLATVRGRVSVVSGELEVADDLRASRLTVTADATSFDSADARRDRAVTAPRFLDAARFPTLEFVSTEVDGDGEVAGVLTAHGVRAPLTWTVEDVEQDADGVTVRATARVDRYAHGVTAMRGMAGRYLDVRVRARATRQTTTAHD